MEEVLLVLVQVFGDILLEVVFGGLGDIAWGAFKALSGRADRSWPAAIAGFLVLGAFLGFLSLLVWPHRLSAPGPIPGLSLVLSPLGAGVVMNAWGDLRRAMGRPATRIASFRGGAALAFGVALVRFLWTR